MRFIAVTRVFLLALGVVAGGLFIDSAQAEPGTSICIVLPSACENAEVPKALNLSFTASASTIKGGDPITFTAAVSGSIDPNQTIHFTLSCDQAKPYAAGGQGDDHVGMERTWDFDGCAYGNINNDPVRYVAKVVAEHDDMQRTATLDVVVTKGQFGVSLTATPTDGTAPLSSALTASLSGQLAQKVDYAFYCDQKEDVIDPSSGTKVKEIKDTDALTAGAACTYGESGTKRARVVVSTDSFPADYYDMVFVAEYDAANVERSCPSGFAVSALSDPFTSGGRGSNVVATCVREGLPYTIDVKVVPGKDCPAQYVQTGTLRDSRGTAIITCTGKNSVVEAEFVPEWEPTDGRDCMPGYTMPIENGQPAGRRELAGNITATCRRFKPGTAYADAAENKQQVPYEVQSGQSTAGWGTKVSFKQAPQNGKKPDAVVASINYKTQDSDNYFVTDLTAEGFTFYGDQAPQGGTFTWIAVWGSVAGSIQAGEINPRQGNVTFAQGFTGNASDVAVVITRGASTSQGGDEYLHVDDVGNSGFKWSGDASDNGPHYYVAVHKGMTLPGESKPFMYGGRLQQSDSHQVKYSDYGFTFKNRTVSAVLSKNWNKSQDEMLHVTIPSGGDATRYFLRDGDGYAESDSKFCVWRICNEGTPRYNYWIATDREYVAVAAEPVPPVVRQAYVDITVRPSLAVDLKVDGEKEILGSVGYVPEFQPVITGTAADETASFRMYCNRTDATPAYESDDIARTSGMMDAAQVDPGSDGIYSGVVRAGQLLPFKYKPCKYVLPGTYHPTVIVTRGTALPAVSQATVYIPEVGLTPSAYEIKQGDRPNFTATAAIPGSPDITAFDYYFFCDRPMVDAGTFRNPVGQSGSDLSSTTGAIKVAGGTSEAFAGPCAYPDADAFTPRVIVRAYKAGTSTLLPGFASAFTVLSASGTPVNPGTPSAGSTLEYGEGSGSF